MTTNPIGGAGAADAATSSQNQQRIDKAEFLTLFLAQLQNQDPLSPMEPTELTSQLAQLSSLEQLTSINDRLEMIAGNATFDAATMVLGLIGREVQFDGGRVGVQDGIAPEVSYALEKRSDAVTVNVIGPTGQLVRKIELGAQSVGPHTFQFDGRDALGALVPDGEYRIQISAKSTGDEAPTPLSLVATARVDGADLTGDQPFLVVGGRRLGLDDIAQVLEADDED
jgi:flagellar basal-body rod modification protein FlgD